MFKFDEMLITDKVLDKLGFSKYWGGSGDFGERKFGVKLSETEFDPALGVYTLIEMDEKDDENDGYDPEPKYAPRYFCSSFGKHFRAIYFLHDLYEDIKEKTPSLLVTFLERCMNNNMMPYIKSYLKSENNENNS
jgi:hypothetical protein